MKQCESCVFYSSAHDEHMQKWDDVSVESSNHYCPMFNEPIDPGIITGEKQCEFYLTKKD